jgi:hypothetical protein
MAQLNPGFYTAQAQATGTIQRKYLEVDKWVGRFSAPDADRDFLHRIA